MRVGVNPNKDEISKSCSYKHHVIIPVYIPNLKGYFQDSMSILHSCLQSLFKTTNSSTFFTVVNNGSCAEVVAFLDNLLKQQQIQELIHTENIGKLNAILKGIVGHDFPFMTITDADVKFLPGWQEATMRIFENFPKAGTVGLTPQFNMFSNYCTNVLFENLFNKNCKFYPVEQPLEMWKFYKSIGRKMPKDHFYFKSVFGIEAKNNVKACIGAGHFVATYRKNLFENSKKYDPHKLGGGSERYLDKAAMKKGYWKLSTFKNYAQHMGNVWEEWMEVDDNTKGLPKEIEFEKLYQIRNSNLEYFIKNIFFKNLLKIYFFDRFFLRYKKLPQEELRKYPKIYY